MDRRTFLKLTTLAGPGLAAGSLLGLGTTGRAAPAPKATAALPFAEGKLPEPTGVADFAVIGDFGAGNVLPTDPLTFVKINPDCLAVAEGIKRFAPPAGSAYVISVGDQIYIPFNNDANPLYPKSAETKLAAVGDYDIAVGQLFRQYIKFPANSTSAYKKQGSDTARFFCVLGDHDWWHQPRAQVNTKLYYKMDDAAYPASAEAQPQYAIDSLPGQDSAFAQYFGEQGQWSGTKNPRYWDLRQGDVHWFALSSDANETLLGTLSNAYYQKGKLPNGFTPGQDNLQNSVQGKWFQQAVGASDAKWKIVLTHYPPYVSSANGDLHGHNPATYMRWGYEKFGVDAVLNGHAHLYERLFVNNCTYIVCGAGGTFESLSEFTSTPLPGSQVRVPNRFGFMTAQLRRGVLELHYLVVNAQLAPGPREVVDRCFLLKGGQLSSVDNLENVSSIIFQQGGGVLNVRQALTVLPAGALLGAGDCRKSGAGTLVVSANSGYQGRLILSQGTVRLLGAQALHENATLSLQGGRLDAHGVVQTFTTPLELSSTPSRLTVDGSTQLAFADTSKTAWRGGLIALDGPWSSQVLRFGTNAKGLTSTQMRMVRFGGRFGPPIKLDSQGYVKPAGPPVITQQPGRKSARAGGTVEFSVRGAGYESVQWTHNGRAVPGTTGVTLKITDVTAADAGRYQVVLTNSVGSAHSRMATLTVAG